MRTAQTEDKILERKGNGINGKGKRSGFMPSLFREIFCDVYFSGILYEYYLLPYFFKNTFFRVKKV
ncbi:MAG: hypothetical protein CMH46_02760 [Muricauda sp.]|nr:hypothetical protein [Allomuricauda sp.]